MSSNLARSTNASVSQLPDNSRFVTPEMSQNCQKISLLGDKFDQIRKTAMAMVTANHPPQASDELWRYTRPELFPWGNLAASTNVELQIENLNNNDKLPDGVKVRSGAHAIQEHSALISDLLEKSAKDVKSEWVVNAHLATLTSLTVVSVDKNMSVNEPIKLSWLLPKVANTSAQPLLIISAQQNASLTIVEDLKGAWNGFFMPRVEVVVGNNAQVNFITTQRLSNESSYLARHRFHTGKDSVLKTVHLALGAKVARVDLDLNMYEPGASVDMIGATVADGKRHLDFHPTQRHIAPNCRSELFCKGVVTGSAQSVYYGYIRVTEGAQKTDAYQTNRNLVLSNTARADSIPNLEIKANDVRCSHGASVGHVSSEDMFYLMSRGLSRKQAERILVEGFLEDVISRVKEQWLHDWLHDMVIARLDNNVA